MIIKSLHLKNFRCFDDFGIEFNTGDGNHGGLTVLVARNGEGKTAILDAINIAWGLYFRKMPKTKGAFFHKEDRKNCDDAMAMASYGYTSLASSFITEHGDKSSIGIVRDCYLDKNGNARTSVKGGMGLDDYARTCLEKRFDNAFLLPLLAYYGEDRLWSEQLKEEESKAVLYQDRALGYSGANNRKSGFKTFYKWYVDLWKSLFDQKIKQMDDRVSFNIDAFRYYQTLNELLSNAVSDALNVTGWNQLDYDNGEKVLYVLNSITREKADIRSLSAGNRIVLGVVGDLVHRCSVLNPHAGKETLAKTPGIVLIDEIELHLHPSWQQQILPTLQRIFPKIQFIVTTHSPQVVSSVPRECVRIVSDGQVMPAYSQTQGVESQDILAGIFGTNPAPQEDEYVQKLNRYARLEAEGKADTVEGKKLYECLVGHYGKNYLPLIQIQIHNEFSQRK